MSCCKCGRRWSEQEAFYEDKATGDKFCLFHAPVEHKGVSVEKFNDLVFERIQEVVNRGDKKSYCDLSDTIFPGDIDFSRFGENNPLPSITFAGSHFWGEAIFNYVVFAEGGEFEQCCFHDEASFVGAVFKESIEFGVTTFEDDAWFEKAIFEKRGWFYRATFRQDAGFSGCQFSEEVKFTRAFFKNVFFLDVIFGGTTYFNEAVFGEEVEFNGATFQGYTWFSRNDFKAGASFKLVKFLGETKIDRVQFQGAGDFLQTVFSNTEFSDISDDSWIVFERCAAEQVYFYRVGLGRCDFVQTDISKAHFIDSWWPDTEGSYYVADEQKHHSPQAIRNFFQRMKRKYKDEHNEYEASKWHLAEKEAHLGILEEETASLRKVISDAVNNKKPLKFEEISNRFIFHLLKLYKISSGFGEKPFQALLWLILLVLLPCIPYLFPGDMRCYIPLLKIRPSSEVLIVTHLWMGLWQLLITFQAALFGFALRNRFRR